MYVSCTVNALLIIITESLTISSNAYMLFQSHLVLVLRIGAS